jgi:hypothetical protein
VKQAPEAARFQFRAHNQWLSGTHNRGTIADYFGVREERTHERTFVFDADHPPSWWAGTTGHARGVRAPRAGRLPHRRPGQRRRRPTVKLTEVRSTVSGDIDLNGIIGLNPAVRNGLLDRFQARRSSPSPGRGPAGTASRPPTG